MAFLLAYASTAYGQNAAPPQPPQPRYLTRDFTVDNFDLATMQLWLGRVGIELPFKLAGEVDLAAKVGIPITALNDGRAYRFHGTAKSSRVVIDDLELLNISAEADYTDGVLSLEELSLHLPLEPGKLPTAGKAFGKAKVELLPRGELTVDVDLERVPIEPLLAAFPELRGAAQGRVSGQATASAAADDLQKIEAWTVEGNLQVSGFESHGFTVAAATAEAKLENAKLTLTRFRADSAAGAAEGKGVLQLLGDQAFTAEFQVIDGDLGQVADMLSAEFGRLDTAGATNASLDVTGTLSPLKITGQGALTASNARFDRFELRSLSLPVSFTGDQLNITDARAELAEGLLVGSAKVALNAAAASQVSLRWNDVQLAALARLLAVESVLPIVGTIQGAASGKLELNVPPGALDDPTRWQGDAQLNVADLVAYAVGFRRAEVDLQLADGVLTINRLNAKEDAETLTGQGNLHLKAPHEFSLKVDWLGGELESLHNVLETNAAPAVRLAGRFGLAANLTGELQPLQVHGDASLSAAGVQFNNVQVAAADLRTTIDDRKLDVSELKLRLYGGDVQGTATIGLEDAQVGQASLVWKQLDVAKLLADAFDYPAQAGSASQGEIRLNIPAGKTFDPRAWRAVGSAGVDDFRVRDRVISQARLQFGLADRLLKLDKLSLTTGAGGIEGSGQLRVDTPHDLAAKLQVDQFDLAFVRDVLNAATGSDVELGGMVSLAADVTGQLAPLEIAGGGSAHGEQLQGGPLLLDDVKFDFNFDRKQLRIADLTSRLYQGVVEGSVQVPLQASQAVDVNLSWRKISAGEAINAVLGESPISLSGDVAGKLEAHVPAGKAADIAAWRANFNFETSDLESNGQPAGKLQGEASLEQSRIDYNLHGVFLDGALEWEGQWSELDEALRRLPSARAARPTAEQQSRHKSRPRLPLEDGESAGLMGEFDGDDLARLVAFQPPSEPVDEGENSGRLRWRGVTFARLRGFLPEGQFPEALDARASLDLQYRHRAGATPTGSGELVVEALSWGGAPLTERLQGRVRLGENRLLLAGFRGRYADGLAQLGANIPLSHPIDLTYELLLTRGKLLPALAPFLDLGIPLESRLDLRLTGQFGSLWKLTGTGSLSDAEFAGADIGQWRVPLTISYDPTSGRAKYSFRHVRGTLARGEVTGDAGITASTRLRVEGAFSFDRVDLETLLEAFGVDNPVGSGRISGDASFEGGNVRELADLSALVDARMQNTSSDAVPVLGPLQSFMPTVLPSTKFTKGELRGRLNRNIFLLERLSLANSSAEVYASGRVSLAGRLNLVVTAGTGSLRRSGRVARILLRSLIAVAQPQLALVMRVNNFLADRVVQVQVTGTTAAPVIRFQPLQLLGDEALRFFLTQAAG